jgi:hypothetical protein
VGTNRLDRTRDRLSRRKNLPLLVIFLLPFLNFQLVDFGFDLRLEFVGSPFEFIQGLTDLPRDSGQLLGPEHKQRQHKNERCIGETHSSIIKEQRSGSNCSKRRLLYKFMTTAAHRPITTLAVSGYFRSLRFSLTTNTLHL